MEECVCDEADYNDHAELVSFEVGSWGNFSNADGQ
jgi:hypothetical protein